MHRQSQCTTNGTRLRHRPSHGASIRELWTRRIRHLQCALLGVLVLANTHLASNPYVVRQPQLLQCEMRNRCHPRNQVGYGRCTRRSLRVSLIRHLY